MGTDNVIAELLQGLSHEILGMNSLGRLPPFIYGSSHTNQRIEAWWAMLRRHNSQFWMNIFEQLKGDGLFTGSFLDKFIVQYCFLEVIQNELNDNFEDVWEFLPISVADEDVYQLCIIISDEMQLLNRESAYDTLNNYVLLRTEIMSLLELN
ncbi:uncharacterized protein LOC116182205 [Photinus pyralis]|uniref:uncharacterized protein LOC116182205 n=1 Tax=Photinus pyralis TaxID=7054 RepID=UPI00126730F2|nr:uncharacterized protein LOC116182205 [Photinus pyralis]XP_031358588.1 uncharacterized protein LOC116182205 [Photinus pyralis]